MSYRLIKSSGYGDDPDNYSLSREGDELQVELVYPRNEDPGIQRLKHVIVGLEDVRATDSVRVTYDFERNGWSIQQASIFEWEVNDEVRDPDWQEVAFVPSWARQKD